MRHLNLPNVPRDSTRSTIGSRRSLHKTHGNERWRKALLPLCVSRMRGAMSDFNLDDLRDELDVYAEPEKTRGRSAVEERVIAGFEEIQRFFEKHGHLPQHGEDKDIFERLYAVRLDRLRAQEEFRALLAPLDHQGHLTASADPLFGNSDTDLDELRAELEGAIGTSNITELRHVRSSVEKRAAEEIANRTVCENFDEYKPIFERVKRELKDGARQTLPFQKLDEIRLAEIQDNRSEEHTSELQSLRHLV